jgi:hypothetical protein
MAKSKHAVLLTLRSVSMQCNAMQCNTMQYNATMQCNAMQYNATCTEVRPSVRNEVSQSFFFIFFIFFFSQYVRSPRHVRNTNVTDGQTNFSYFSCQYVRMSRMDNKFQLFQFSFSSVAYSQVSLSVRTEVPTKKKKRRKKNVTDKHKKHRSDRISH